LESFRYFHGGGCSADCSSIRHTNRQLDPQPDGDTPGHSPDYDSLTDTDSFQNTYAFSHTLANSDPHHAFTYPHTLADRHTYNADCNQNTIQNLYPDRYINPLAYCHASYTYTNPDAPTLRNEYTRHTDNYVAPDFNTSAILTGLVK
jgi:hypothetical protein